MLHTTSYLQMKADTARTFLLAIATMVISVIPTWRTQHEAYIQARLKLVRSLEEETILAAMVADHATQTLDMYVTHEPCTCAGDAYTHVYPACDARVPGDLPESRHHAARCAAVGDATHRADCLVLYLVPWCLVWGYGGAAAHKRD